MLAALTCRPAWRSASTPWKPFSRSVTSDLQRQCNDWVCVYDCVFFTFLHCLATNKCGVRCTAC